VIGPLRLARLRAWWDARHPPADTLLLTQRNVYILPTRGGWLWALLVLTLLLGAINYQLNLGYLLCFVLAGVALVSMHSCHATLRGLRLRLAPPDPVHAGSLADLVVHLVSERGGRAARHGIGIRLDTPPPTRPPAMPHEWTWLDVAATPSARRLRPGATAEPPVTQVHLALPCPLRGRHVLPRLQLETRFPFGLFRAWSVWRPAAQVLVWPTPEQPTPSWPLSVQDPSRADRPLARLTSASSNPLDADSARPYRPGDSPREVLWKKSASAIAAGSDPALVSRTGSGAAARPCLDFTWESAAIGAPSGATSVVPPDVTPGTAPGAAAGARPSPGNDTEARLSRLTAWALAADRDGEVWALHLPGQAVARGQGPAQRRAALDALACFDPSGGAAPPPSP
jgi:uncharacterized protein (DUF58 family)